MRLFAVLVVALASALWGGRAMAQSAAALGASNEAVQGAWGALRPGIEADLAKALGGLAGKKFEKRGFRFEVRTVEMRNARLARAPGLAQADASRIAVRVPSHTASTPASDLWAFELRCGVRASYKGGFLNLQTITIDRSITASVTGFKVAQDLILDGSDPTLPRVRSLGSPVASFQLQITSDAMLVQALLDYLNPWIRDTVAPIGSIAAAFLIRDLEALAVGHPRAPLGEGTPRVSDDGAPADLYGPAKAILAELRRAYLPYGTLVEAEFTDAYTGTVRGGDVAYVHAHGDSAIWTGHLLAALAYQYAAGSAADKAEALAVADEVLTGLDRLSRLGSHGQLARVAVPFFSDATEPMLREEAHQGVFARTLEGRLWAYAGNISRDQYCGVFFGLAAAYTLMPDPAVRARAAAIGTRLLDYLVANDFVARQTEDMLLSDRAKMTTPPGAVAPLAMYVYHVESRLALLQAGRLMNPARFQAAFDRFAPASELVWLAPWIASSDPANQYFKFNLDHAHITVLMRYETSAARWRHYQRAQRIMQRATGSHQNVHFDLCHLSISPADRSQAQSYAWHFGADVQGTQAGLAAVQGQARALLRTFLTRPARYVEVDLTGDPTIAKHTYTAPDTGETKLIALRPVPLAKRPCTDFVWQRSPFVLKGRGTGKRGAPGVDYLLPYWMGRYYGAVR